MTFFITPFHYTDCFSVRQIGYGGTGEIEANRICYNALLTTAFEREQLILLLSNDKPLTSVREAWQAEQAENYDMGFSHTILRFCEDIRQAQQPEMTM